MDRPLKQPPSNELIRRLLSLSPVLERYLATHYKRQESEQALAAFEALGRFTSARLEPQAQAQAQAPAPAPAQPQASVAASAPFVARELTPTANAAAAPASPLHDPDVLRALREFHRAHQPVVSARVTAERARQVIANRAPEWAAPTRERSRLSRRAAGFATILKPKK